MFPNDFSIQLPPKNSLILHPEQSGRSYPSADQKASAFTVRLLKAERQPFEDGIQLIAECG
jgi:hypothetical protein